MLKNGEENATVFLKCILSAKVNQNFVDEER